VHAVRNEWFTVGRNQPASCPACIASAQRNSPSVRRSCSTSFQCDRVTLRIDSKVESVKHLQHTA
jgi:hypothetical protein